MTLLLSCQYVLTVFKYGSGRLQAAPRHALKHITQMRPSEL
jgi:hypothetical protein